MVSAGMAARYDPVVRELCAVHARTIPSKLFRIASFALWPSPADADHDRYPWLSQPDPL